MQRRRRRILAVMLILLMVGTTCGSYVMADMNQQKTADGLCEHHPEHTADCGYAEATESSPCTHEHTEDCYTTDENGEQILNCQHVHDETCGYKEAAQESPCTYVCDICNGNVDGDGNTVPTEDENNDADGQSAETAVQITSWIWVDEEEMLQEMDGGWGLGLPGASEENPLTQDLLLEMLPKQITAETKTADTQGTETAQTGEAALDLVWDLSSIPEEGIWSGDHVFTAGLPEGYALAEGVQELSVTVQLGQAASYTTLPSGSLSNAPFSNHIENSVSPIGTTINLFDYWLTEQTQADNEDPDWVLGTLYNNRGQSKKANVPDLQNKGINAGHAFLFGTSLGSNFGTWNQWTGTAAPRSGIVNNTLSAAGFPVLNLSQNAIDSAQYTESGTGYYSHLLEGRTPAESLAYLFDPSIETEGKASYTDVKGLLQVDANGYYYYDSAANYAVFYEQDNSFAVYDEAAVTSGGAAGNSGQFFPFNAATDVFNDNYTANSIKSTDEALNHYFGLTMSTRFIQQYGGYTTADQTAPVTYDFSGDDDVWVFIDDTLVADLGGIHNAASLSINFVTGEIKINGIHQNASLGKLLGYDSDTLPDNTYHTLDFFYLERGNVDSNMKLKYNLVTIPESSVIKVDQTGDAVAGAQFDLYAANNPTTPIATGTTNRNGEFVFVDEQDFPITISELYAVYKDAIDSDGNNLILKETYVPAGYRSNGDLGLRFYVTAENEVLLLSNNQWDVGAYAMSKVTTTAPNTIVETDGGSNSVDLMDVENPLMFGVVLQKQSDGTWCPVYGDPLEGWTVTGGSSWNDIRTAVLANPYIFQLASSGAYQIEIENLPGDITKYYHVCGNESEAEYTVAYYYTTANTLSGINSSNTWRIEPEAEGAENQFDRVFSVNLYVPNIKNRLFIQKVDEAGSPVNGADFALYKEDQISIDNDDGTVTVTGDPYDSRTTMHIEETLDLEGGGVFPTSAKGILECGVYYLIETSAPSGYVLNDTATKIVVDNTGVYADAGIADDGISVLKGVGSIVRSMVQFAADDNVDTTLNSIKAGLTTAIYNNYNLEGSFSWNADDVKWDSDNILHLQYENQYNVLDYGLTGADEKGTFDTLTLKSETGWPKLLIQQCYQHDNTVNTDRKENLGTRDLTKIFSGTTLVRVANQRVGSLQISKTVTGENALADTSFTFEVELKDLTGAALNGTFATSTGDGNQGTITFTDGKDQVTLKDGESLTITNLPVGTAYTVKEIDIPAGFTPSVTTGGAEGATDTASGTIAHNSTAAVGFTNTYSNNVTINPEGQKTLDGRNLTAGDAYGFTLTPDDAAAAAIADGSITVADSYNTASVTGDGTGKTADFIFGDITFKTAGSYTFTITENLPQGVSADSPAADGIKYDTHSAVVTVTVAADETTGLLSADVVYSNTGAPFESVADRTDLAAFTNQDVGGCSFTKTDRDGMDGNRLSGASFAIYRLTCSDSSHDHDSSLIDVANSETGAIDTEYEYADCWELTAVITSGSDGSVSFTNLPVSGEYRLAEIKAPDGYTIPTGQWRIAYDADEGAFAPLENAAVGKPVAIGTSESGYYIVNYRPGELPFAGNTGIRMFLLIGGILMAAGAAGTFWYLRRKRRMA